MGLDGDWEYGFMTGMMHRRMATLLQSIGQKLLPMIPRPPGASWLLTLRSTNLPSLLLRVLLLSDALPRWTHLPFKMLGSGVVLGAAVAMRVEPIPIIVGSILMEV